MTNADPQQSFTATISIDNKAVALAQKVLQKKIEDPETTEELREFYRSEQSATHNLMTFSEYGALESFFFAYYDGVYVIKIKGSDGNFGEPLSMEGTLRNWTVFGGTDPTFFRIKDRYGEELKMTDLPDQSEVLLYSGPQHRPVCTYGELPNLQVITDHPNRGGQLAVFKLNIIKRFSYNGH